MEETTTVEPTETTDTTQETVQETTQQVIGDDGKFTETWRESLSEDIRAEKCLDTIRDIDGLAKMFVHTKRMVGKETIAIPGENSSEADWDTFYISAGRPDTAADYNLKRPDNFPEDLFDSNRASKAQDLFLKLGLSKKQSDAIFQMDLDDALAARQDMTNSAELADKELRENLAKEWGQAGEQQKHFGNLAIDHGTKGDEDFRSRLTQKFGNDPDFIKYSANLGSKFAEASGAPATVPTPVEINEKIAEVMATKAYIGGPDISPAEHKSAVEKVKRMFEERSPE